MPSPASSHGAVFELEAARELLERNDARDRAFVDAMIRMQWARTSGAEERAKLLEFHAAVRQAALRSHTDLRARIADGTLRGRPLRERFDAVPLLERDHLVEEVLGIAYPPLDEPTLSAELVGYMPSGYDEIVHAFDVTALGPGDRFLDVGAGLGKTVMLATLLAGATSSGVEFNAELHGIAEAAAAALELGDAHFVQGDARDVTLADADVVFMYLPFTGAPLRRVMTRLIEQGRASAPAPRARYLCAGALDLREYPELTLTASPKSWLHIHAWR